MFSRDLEPWLSRDSLEGFDRYRYGQKSPSEFKSQGRRSVTRVQLLEGPYAGAWGYSVPGEAGLGTRPFPQVGFARSAEGPFSWFMLDGLPTKDHLKTLGFADDVHVRLCECDPSEAIRRLSDVGMTCGRLDSFPPPSGPAQMEHVFRLELPHRRALAKIALNYVAHQFGAQVTLDASFHQIRALVMTGTEPDYKYFDMDQNPIIDGDKRTGSYLGHALLVLQKHRQIEGVVSLYNRFRHGFLLARDSSLQLEPKGHFFDISHRAIIPMSPAGELPRSAPLA